MLIQKQDNPDLAARAAGKKLSDLCAKYADQNIYLLISGGSALEVLQFVDIECLASHACICVIDERYDVAKEHQNYHVLSQMRFARRLIERGGTVCNGALSGAASLEEAEDVMEQHLQTVAASDSIVISLLGIGSDGHTVGMMPYPEDRDFFEMQFLMPGKFAAGYDAGDKNAFPLRVTTSGTFLKNHVDHTVVYAVGEDKSEAIAKMYTQDADMHFVPSRILHHMSDVTVYTDQVIEGYESK